MDEFRQKIQKMLDDQINPALAAHGGSIALIDVQGKNLLIRMEGGCQGCGMASYTLRQGIEAALRQHFPEISEIIDVTDHAHGDHPFYAPSDQ